MGDWHLMEPPTLKDEGKYDIELKDGRIIKNVEFWAMMCQFHLGKGTQPHERFEGKDVLKWKSL